MRPVRAPQHTVGKRLDNALREGHDVAIGGALAVQRLRPGYREPFWTAHLRPHVWVLAHELDEQLELGAVDRLAYVRATHVVDDDRGRQRAEEVP